MLSFGGGAGGGGGRAPGPCGFGVEHAAAQAILAYVSVDELKQAMGHQNGDACGMKSPFCKGCKIQLVFLAAQTGRLHTIKNELGRVCVCVGGWVGFRHTQQKKGAREPQSAHWRFFGSRAGSYTSRLHTTLFPIPSPSLAPAFNNTAEDETTNGDYHCFRCPSVDTPVVSWWRSVALLPHTCSVNHNNPHQPRTPSLLSNSPTPSHIRSSPLVLIPSPSLTPVLNNTAKDETSGPPLSPCGHARGLVVAFRCPPLSHLLCQSQQPTSTT